MGSRERGEAHPSPSVGHTVFIAHPSSERVFPIYKPLTMGRLGEAIGGRVSVSERDLLQVLRVARATLKSIESDTEELLGRLDSLWCYMAQIERDLQLELAIDD